MTGRGGVPQIITGGVTTTAAAAVLPNTAGNSLGNFLAYLAIAIGVTTIVSQIAVRVVRKRLSA